MPLTTTKEMLLRARAGGYAVCAFNAENMEMAQAITAAAVRMRAPVIIQTTPSTVKYAGPDYFYALVSVAAKSANIPIALHLDHGDSFELVCRAIEAGYTSVMFDGSRYSFDENTAATQKAAQAAKAAGLPIEGELGRVGGKEDGMEAGGGGYTDPQEAARFVSLTGVDSLAVGIGTAHGFYAETPVLDLARLTRIRELVQIPLVLHGATGLSDEAIAECVRRGICKVNFATELRAAYTAAVRDTLAADAAIVDVKIYGERGRQAVADLAMRKIRISGSEGKA